MQGNRSARLLIHWVKLRPGTHRMERAGPSQSAGLASDPTGEVMMRGLRAACLV